MATTTEILQQIQFYQNNLAQLQAVLDARFAAVADVSVSRLSAEKAYSIQASDPAHIAAWQAEEVAHGNDLAALWMQPEHAYWLRLAKDAITAGVMDPAF